MNFKELRKNFSVYILNKETIEYWQGKVVQDATPPRLDGTFGQPMLTDVSIESNNSTRIWTLPADQKVAEMQNDPNVIISTDKNTIVAMAKNIQQECESYLQGIDKTKKRLEAVNKLVAELDITYKQQQQTEERFSRIEDSIKMMENTLSQILNAVK